MDMIKHDMNDKRNINESIEPIFSENDFTDKHGYELLRFVFRYLNDLLPIIRRKKRTKSPFEFLTDRQKTIYYLSCYDCILDEDSLEQLYEVEGSVEEIKALADGFRIIGRNSDATLIESALKKGKMTDKTVKKLLDHFRETDTVIQEIETEIEKFIKANIMELLKLQTI
jgi:hypothetical protein